MKKLTADIVKMRTKSDKLESIKNINLWGNELEDVSVVRTMPGLEVVSLSVNKIRSLKDFSHLKNLRELYLRKNMITDLNEICYLAKCPSLRTLWLSENPISDLKGYRIYVINKLPQITKLDDNIITAEERQLAAQNVNNLEDSMEYPINDEENVFENKYEVPEVKEEIYSNNVRNKKIIKQGGFNVKRRQDEDIINNFSEMNLIDKKEIQKDLRRRNTTNPIDERVDDNMVFQKKPTSAENEYIVSKRKNDEYLIRQKQDDFGRNRDRSPERNRNIYNCVLMMLEELNENELESLRNEIDKKLS